MKNFLYQITIAFCLLTLLPLCANEDFDQEHEEFALQETPVHVEILQENETIEPGQPFFLLLSFSLEDNWHTYWKNPGNSGMPVSIDWKLPKGFSVKSVSWPHPKRFTADSVTSDSIVGFGYEKKMELLVELEAPNTMENSEVTIGATLDWLSCSATTCLPGDAEIETTLIVKNEKPIQKNGPYFETFRDNLPKNHWNVEATLEDQECITLKVKPPKDETRMFTKGYFCPEVNDLVDHKTITEFNHVADGDFHYPVNLKRQGQNSDQTLKGVLVLVNEKEKTEESLDINVPMPQLDDSTIGFVDRKEIQKEMEAHKETTEEREPSEFENNFALALLFAFIGGMLLNLMPCVLPVLSLKVFSFVKMAKTSRFNQFKHGAAFSIGVLISFWILAGALLILQAYGKSVGWGFQLQEPIFVALLISIIFILGLNLFGVMELGTGITSLAGNVSHKKEGLSSSFFSGVLATAVATPCTGPFLGSAIGYAVTLPAYLALLIFTALGIGMSFPYLILAVFPSLLRFIPKPGNWMITFKEIMGFLMMATTIWLLWVFSAETSSLSTVILVGSLLIFAIACWIYGKWGSPLKKKRTRFLSYTIAGSFLLLGVLAIGQATSSTFAMSESHESKEIASNWEPFSPARIKELQAQGTPVFVDFTAKWCLICQVNHMVLQTAEDQFNQAGVVRMKADWTKRDPVITEELKKFGRNSVPLYVLYGSEKENPKILPQVLTSDIVSNHLNGL